MASSPPAWLDDLFRNVGNTLGSGTTPLSSTDPISQWGNPNTPGLGDRMGFSDPNYGGLKPGADAAARSLQMGGPPLAPDLTRQDLKDIQGLQPEKSLWEKITSGLGTADPADVSKALQKLGGQPGGATPPQFKAPPAQAANVQYPAGHFTQGSPIGDPRAALRRLIQGY